MKSFTTSLFLLACFFSNAQQRVSSTIEHVTVYYKGASVERIAKVSLPKGKSKVTFIGISSLIDQESIKLTASANIDFYSIKNEITSTPINEINLVNKQKKDIEARLYSEKQNLRVFEREEEMLLKNQVIGGSYAGLKAADLKEAVEFHRTRMQEIIKKKAEINKQIEAIENEIQTVNQKLTEITENNKSTNAEIIVEVFAKEAVPSAEIIINYMVSDAGWKPTYNFKVENIAKPAHLMYKAQVYQYTGEDWTNIKLSMANGNITLNSAAPQLLPWYWGKPNDYTDYFKNIEEENSDIITYITGKVYSASDKVPIIGCSVHIKGTNLGTTTDINGNFKLNIPPDKIGKSIQMVVANIGYLTQEKPIVSKINNIGLEEDTKSLQEVVVVGYGNTQYKRSVEATVARDNETKKEMLTLVTEKENPTSQNYDLLERITILADGAEVNTTLKEITIPAHYEYITVPKITTDAFLIANIANWQQYGLQPGDISLFYEGTYVGKTPLKLVENDTLQISMGRDKSILVKREKIKQYSKNRLIGNKQIENQEYKISIKNIKSTEINLSVYDQIPISNNKDIEVEDVVASGAVIDQETGRVYWFTKIGSAQEKQYKLKYSVKYPKDVVIADE